MSPDPLGRMLLVALLVCPVVAAAKTKVVVRSRKPAPAVAPAPTPATPASGALTALWLPFDGTWAVQSDHGAKTAADRAGLRFQKVDAQGSPKGPRAGNAGYHSWNVQIYAPFDGEVVDLENGVRDNAEPGEINRKKPLGNHVLLRHPDGDFTLLGHLRRGSIVVRKGAHVRCGDLIGRCGNSGDSPSPQLRLIQLAAVQPSAPVPPLFTLYAAGAAPAAPSLVIVGTPRAGEVVEPREAGLYVAPRAGTYVPRPWQASGAVAGSARPAPRPGTSNAGPTAYSAPVGLVTNENVSGPGSAGPDHPAPGNLRGRPGPRPAPSPVAGPVVQPVVTPQPAAQPVVAAQPAPQPVVAAQPAPQPVVVAQPAPQPVVAAQPAPQPATTAQPTAVAPPVVQPVTPVVSAPVQPVTPEDDGGKHKGRGADRDGDGQRDADQDRGKDGGKPEDKDEKPKHVPEKPATPAEKSPVPETKEVPGPASTGKPDKPDQDEKGGKPDKAEKPEKAKHAPEKPATPAEKSPVPETKEVPGSPPAEKAGKVKEHSEESEDGTEKEKGKGKDKDKDKDKEKEKVLELQPEVSSPAADSIDEEPAAGAKSGKNKKKKD